MAIEIENFPREKGGSFLRYASLPEGTMEQCVYTAPNDESSSCTNLANPSPIIPTMESYQQPRNTWNKIEGS